MKLIIAIIKPDCLEAVKVALAKVEVFRLTVSDVTTVVGDSAAGMTWGQFPAARLEIAVNENFVRPTLDALQFAGVIENDVKVHRVDFRRAGSRTKPKPGRMLIRISRWETELPDAFEHYRAVLESEKLGK